MREGDGERERAETGGWGGAVMRDGEGERERAETGVGGRCGERGRRTATPSFPPSLCLALYLSPSLPLYLSSWLFLSISRCLCPSVYFSPVCSSCSPLPLPSPRTHTNTLAHLGVGRADGTRHSVGCQPPQACPRLRLGPPARRADTDTPWVFPHFYSFLGPCIDSCVRACAWARARGADTDTPARGGGAGGCVGVGPPRAHACGRACRYALGGVKQTGDRHTHTRARARAFYGGSSRFSCPCPPHMPPRPPPPAHAHAHAHTCACAHRRTSTGARAPVHTWRRARARARPLSHTCARAP